MAAKCADPGPPCWETALGELLGKFEMWKDSAVCRGGGEAEWQNGPEPDEGVRGEKVSTSQRCQILSKPFCLQLFFWGVVGGGRG